MIIAAYKLEVGVSTSTSINIGLSGYATGTGAALSTSSTYPARPGGNPSDPSGLLTAGGCFGLCLTFSRDATGAIYAQGGFGTPSWALGAGVASDLAGFQSGWSLSGSILGYGFGATGISLWGYNIGVKDPAYYS